MMSCNKDENCRNIANYYQNISKNVKNSYVKIYGEIGEVAEKLSMQVIPEDYLGEKIKDKLEKLKLVYEENIEIMSITEKQMMSFIDEKRIEHKKHFNEWFEQQIKEKEEK